MNPSRRGVLKYLAAASLGAVLSNVAASIDPAPTAAEPFTTSASGLGPAPSIITRAQWVPMKR